MLTPPAKILCRAAKRVSPYQCGRSKWECTAAVVASLAACIGRLCRWSGLVAIDPVGASWKAGDGRWCAHLTRRPRCQIPLIAPSVLAAVAGSRPALIQSAGTGSRRGLRQPPPATAQRQRRPIHSPCAEGRRGSEVASRICGGRGSPGVVNAAVGQELTSRSVYLSFYSGLVFLLNAHAYRYR